MGRPTRPVKQLRIFRSWISEATAPASSSLLPAGRCFAPCSRAGAQVHGVLVVVREIGTHPATAEPFGIALDGARRDPLHCIPMISLVYSSVHFKHSIAGREASSSRAGIGQNKCNR